jgi:hypothetical protein
MGQHACPKCKLVNEVPPGMDDAVCAGLYCQTRLFPEPEPEPSPLEVEVEEETELDKRKIRYLQYQGLL